MPPKSAKAAAAAAAQKDVQETEDPLQAVVLTDSFETRFSPFTDDHGELTTPRCLLPLAGVPLLEYTLPFLARSGVEQVFLYCGTEHAERIEAYLSDSPWTATSSPFKLEIVRSTSRTIGDAMRDLDKRAILGGDFIVVYGDVVCSVPLGPVLAAHRARRAADRNAIMTMLLRDVGPHSAHHQADARPMFVLDAARDRCLHYETLRADQSRTLLDAEALAQDVDVRTDLLDVGVDVCTPEVLALWSDNFDYEHPRSGFLHGVLKDHELNGKTVHAYVASGAGYAARVRDLAAYDAVSRDVVARWALPFAPDANLGGGAHVLAGLNVYRDKGARVAKSAVVGPNVVLGPESRVEAGCVVRDSVIGRGCSVGGRSRLDGAYLWNGSSVGEGCTLRRCVVGAGTSVGSNSTLVNGALVDAGLSLADGTTVVGPRKVIGKRKRGAATQNQTEYELVAPTEDEAGTGLAKTSECPAASERAMQETNTHIEVATLKLSPSKESISTIHSDSEDELSEEGAELVPTLSAGSDESGQGAAGEAFVTEAANSIYDGLKQSHDSSTIQLELQGLRMSANASEHQVRRAVVGGLMRHLAEATAAGQQAKNIVAESKTLVERTVFDGSSSSGKPDQADFLLLAQGETAKRGPGSEGLFVGLCNGLYLVEDFDDGVFETDAFEAWWADERSQGSKDLERVRAKMEQFMSVIGDDEDDSEVEEDSEEESD